MTVTFRHHRLRVIFTYLRDWYFQTDSLSLGWLYNRFIEGVIRKPGAPTGNRTRDHCVQGRDASQYGKAFPLCRHSIGTTE